MDGHENTSAIDRRRIVGGGVGLVGAAWMTPTVLSLDAAGAQASGVCAPAGSVDLSNSTAFPGGTPGAGLGFYPWNMGTFAGTTATLTISGNTDWVQFGASGVTRTCVQTGTTGGVTGYWRIDRDEDANGGTQITSGPSAETVIEIALSQQVCNFSVTILDADQELGGGSVWTDQVVLEPFLGATPVVGSFTPGSTMSPNTVQNGSSVTFTGNSVSNVADSSPDANVVCSVVDPIDRFVVRYRMAMPGGVPGDRQHVGISSMSWTP